MRRDVEGELLAAAVVVVGGAAGADKEFTWSPSRLVRPVEVQPKNPWVPPLNASC